MNSTRRIDDDKCKEQQLTRDNKIHDYCLNRPANNCKTNDCFEPNPEIRASHNNGLKDISKESTLMRIDSKDDCNLGNDSCNGKVCKTQIFENIESNKDCETNLNTVNSRLDYTDNIMEQTFDRFTWLHYSPQQHTVTNDSNLNSISSRLDIKNNYKTTIDTKPKDTTNELDYNRNISNDSYEVGILPKMHQNPDRVNNHYKFLN